MGVISIPSSWSRKKLFEFAEVKGGNGFPLRYQSRDSQISFLKVSDLGKIGDSKYLDSSNYSISNENLAILKARVFQKDTIIFAKIGAAVFLERKRILKIDACIDNNLAGIILTNNDVDVEFLHYLLENYRISNHMTATALPSINTQDLLKAEFNLPLLDEQKEIAGVLRDIDALINNLKREILKRRNFRIAITQEKLTNHSGKMVRLGNHANFYKGSGLAKADLAESGDYPAIHYGELFLKYPETISETISSTNKIFPGSFLSRSNDVLMPSSDVTPTGLSVASCITVDDVILGGDVLVVRPDKNLINGSYLSYIIRNSREQILRLVNGTTVFHIYGKDLAKFEFRLPDINEQNEVVFLLDSLRNEIDSLEKELHKYECIKQGMKHDLLTGKVRLV